MANYRDLSKFISLILRHKPETIGISLDEHGWANVDELLAGIGRTRPIDMEILEEIVRTDEKQRYTFNEAHTCIRANQGHSIQVDGEPVVYKVAAGAMAGDGFKFWRSENGVWLTKHVPPKYLEKQQ